MVFLLWCVLCEYFVLCWVELRFGCCLSFCAFFVFLWSSVVFWAGEMSPKSTWHRWKNSFFRRKTRVETAFGLILNYKVSWCVINRRPFVNSCAKRDNRSERATVRGGLFQHTTWLSKSCKRETTTKGMCHRLTFQFKTKTHSSTRALCERASRLLFLLGTLPMWKHVSYLLICHKYLENICQNWS